ncbi:GNAT family N-acetyltransferase (plasmid) [Staphylococcus simulans]|uniref:GNAT family N-acetyltransferase n=1 Tax=Staphylococcus simulans TaxID=1286 RepID=UPI0021D34B15|nr:GNAT family N-acetyltransferase [Staphylococcus simulans]UXR53834.1 GNAT family N-acetyltransferase [Staphylococcus simulans]
MFEKVDVIDSALLDLLLLANPSKELLLEHLESGECFIYKNNFEVLGCYVLKEINKNRVELLDIAVSENKQGLGIGKKLLSHLFNYVKKSGYAEIIVGTGISSI